ncbi:hypothetical protein QYE76_065402 [Lolium multiflorum]|uniref:Uncharacterized protein n=1 Tax=Lolium multiflorum TaxID=4521 RepID=A0AAD8WB66_LOLMU|nr:hypothetical protein QYE76_065402 [Lolium multiflorum]
MVKKRNLTLAASAASSGAAAKASSSAPKKSASDASAPAPAPTAPEVSMAGPVPGDWPASTATKRDEKKARSLGIISAGDGNVILPGEASRLNPPAGFTVMFMSFLYRGLSLPAHEFLRRLLHGLTLVYGKRSCFVKRDNCSSGSFVTGGVGFVVRKEVNYFNFPIREFVQGWRLKWFNIKDSSATNMQLPRFADVLEAVPKRSWKNILSPKGKPSVDGLFDRVLRIKESDGQTMMGTAIAVIFLKRRIQPVMSRAHPMWLYSGPMDDTRVNVAEVSEKELLDEVRRLTHFSQEDSIPLLSLQPPFDIDHPPTEVLPAPEHFQDMSGDNLEERSSSIPAKFRTEVNADPEDEDNDPINPEAFSIDPRSFADDMSDTAESYHDDDAHCAAFVDAAAEKANALPPKRSSGGFADEDDLFDL